MATRVRAGKWIPIGLLARVSPRPAIGVQPGPAFDGLATVCSHREGRL